MVVLIVSAWSHGAVREAIRAITAERAADRRRIGYQSSGITLRQCSRPYGRPAYGVDAAFMSLEQHGWGTHVVRSGAGGARACRGEPAGRPQPWR